MKRIVLIGAFAVSSLLPLGAQNDGGISDGMLLRIRASYEDTPADRALRNAICNNDIRKLVVNQPNQGEIDTYFSHRGYRRKASPTSSSRAVAGSSQV